MKKLQNKKIKILFAINCMNIGGAPTVVYEQIKKIDKNLFDPYLLTLYPSREANYIKKIDFLDKNRIIGYNLKNRSIFDLKTLLKIFLFLKKEKIDIVYTHLFLPNLLIRILAVIARTPIILSFEHSIYTNKKYWQIKADKFLSFFSDRILVSTKAVADFTSQQENIKIEKFEIIPNPVNIPEKSFINAQNLKKEYGIPSNAFIALCLGRLSTEKGQIDLIELADKLKQVNDFYILIVGHGPQKKHLEEEIKRRNLSERCRLIIEPEKAKEFYHTADIFILPSRREGQSIVTYEALKAGIPVVAYELDGIKDIIKEGYNGFYAPTGNIEMMLEKIKLLYSDREMLKKMSANCTASVQNYSKENDGKFEEFLRKIINEKKRKIGN